MLTTFATGIALACVAAAPGLTLDDVGELPRGTAVGLVVPDAGPTTSEARARAALESGRVVNSLRDELPSGPRRVRLNCSEPLPPVVGVPQGGAQPNDRRYLVLLHDTSGLVSSDSTRIPGLISIADIGSGHVRLTPYDGDRVRYLRALDARIDANNRWRIPITVLFAAVVAAAAFVAPFAALAALPVALLGNLALGVAGLGGVWGLALLASPLVRRQAPAFLCVATIGAYAIAMALDATYVALSPLGPSQNSRFYGISNLLETIFLPVVLVGAAAAWRRLSWPGFAGVGVLALVTIAAGPLGADAGGALVLVAALATLAALLLRGRRSLLIAVALGVAAVVILLAAASSHVADALGNPLVAAGDRLELAWLRATANVWTAGVVIVCIAALAALVARGPRRPLPLALASGLAVSFVVNDSPLEVAVLGLASYVALARAEAQPERRSVT